MPNALFGQCPIFMQVNLGILRAQRGWKKPDSSVSFNLVLVAIASSRRFICYTNLTNTLKLILGRQSHATYGNQSLDALGTKPFRYLQP
ncbi:hypothetical protein [Calothrix sp. NIES-2100]|uniref:hypothetical protein n=1 Tax=Calothrix sp. NIES-2100 TaxID=1954172 RepID=UPI0030D9A965